MCARIQSILQASLGFLFPPLPFPLSPARPPALRTTFCAVCVRFPSRFELLEQLSKHQEAAYERLYRWVQDRCQTLEEETPAADVTLQVRSIE